MLRELISLAWFNQNNGSIKGTLGPFWGREMVKENPLKAERRAARRVAVFFFLFSPFRPVEGHEITFKSDFMASSSPYGRSANLRLPPYEPSSMRHARVRVAIKFDSISVSVKRCHIRPGQVGHRQLEKTTPMINRRIDGLPSLPGLSHTQHAILDVACGTRCHLLFIAFGRITPGTAMMVARV